jgi:hypothetical protein
MISILVNAAARADLQNVEHHAVLIENHAPISNAQSIAVATLELLDIVRRAGRRLGILLDLAPDQSSGVGSTLAPRQRSAGILQ